MNPNNDDDPRIQVLSHEELVDRAREAAQFTIEQCDDEMSGPFIILSSMAVLLSAAASLAVIGKVETESAMLILRQLIDAHHGAEREMAN